MLRTFKDFSVVAAGTPQPLIGTTLSAAASPAPDPRNPLVSLVVADSSICQKGDSVMVQEVDGTLAERRRVFGIPDATHIQVDALDNAHASGARVFLSIPVQSVYVQTNSGNTGAVYVGNRRDMVKATGIGVSAVLQQVVAGNQPTEWLDGRYGPANINTSGEIWIDGTTADKYRVTLGVV